MFNRRKTGKSLKVALNCFLVVWCKWNANLRVTSKEEQRVLFLRVNRCWKICVVQTIQATYDTAQVKKWEKPPWMVSIVYESAYLEDIRREQRLKNGNHIQIPLV